MFPILLYGAMMENDALLQVGVDQKGNIWIRSLQQDCEPLSTRKDALNPLETPVPCGRKRGA